MMDNFNLSCFKENPILFHPDKKPLMYKEGDFQVILLNQSLIKQIVKRGNYVDYCARRLKEVYINKDYVELPTLSMKKGRMFEQLFFLGKSFEYFPKKKPTSKTIREAKIDGEDPFFCHKGPSTDELRIIEQAARSKQIVKHHKMVIDHDAKNYWTRVYRHWDKNDIENTIVIINGEMDLVSPIEYKDEFFEKAVIDVKLTVNLDSTFGDFAWGKPESMDHFQAITYNYLTGLPFFYLVFEYNSSLKYKFFKKAIDTMAVAEFHETINKAVQELIHMQDIGWPPNSNVSQVCERCPVNISNGGYCDMQKEYAEI